MSAAGPDLRRGADGVRRCWWCGDDPLYVAYHDREWGRPLADDRRLFEKICLEGFQCGLSWLTILRKRERFREHFLDFDPEQVAALPPRRVRRMLEDPGIVRHRGKIESAVNNARRALVVAAEFGSLAAYLWSFAPSPRRHRRPAARSDLPATSDAAGALSGDLKRRGFTYVGPTTMYAFMQSAGMVNDHLRGCAAGARAAARRRCFAPPAGGADNGRPAASSS